MAGETTITVIGNLTADPELRLHPAGRGDGEVHRRVDPADVRPRPGTSEATATRCS